MNSKSCCTLCGLPVKRLKDPEETVFCCNGCKMVYAMLLESTDHQNPAHFKDTDLYKECVAAGVIPDISITNPGSSPVVTQDDHDKQEISVTDSGKANTDGHTGPDNLLTLHLQIHDMWCPACAWVLEKVLTQSKGIITASCNFSSDRGNVQYDPVQTSPDKIFATIDKLGYTSTRLDHKPKKNTKEFIRLFVSLFLTMNVMMLSWAIYSGFFIELSTRSVQLLAWPIFLMASVVVFYGGRPIYMRAMTSVKSGRPGMETLITTGSFATYSYSLFHLFKGSIHLYFDAACMLILLTLTGKMLERSAKAGIAEGLSQFFSLIPQKVKLCTPQFPTGRYVSIEQLSKGDTFLAEQGEILAADGIVTNGSALIDESSITGEAKPIRVALSHKVKSGTRIISGSIRVTAVKVGKDSILGRMLSIMENSLSGKTAQTQRFEKFLHYFVPGIMGLSVFTFFFWIITGLSSYEAFNRAISVLVISCPCALGIAIPLALVAGVSAAGKQGILVRDFEAFEQIQGLDTIVFDKTGTLTTGKLVVLGMDTAKDFSTQKAWQLICSMEKESDHYIAHTIKNYGHKKKLEPLTIENIQCHPNGITCDFQGQEYHFGSLDFVQEEATPPSFVSSPQQGAQVISTIFLSVAHKIVAAVHMGDSMKNGIASLISELKKKEFSIFLISGDAQTPTQNAGSFVNISTESTHGGLLPHEKADFIKALKQSGKKTAMVGDGVNDAPAMSQSDIAIAVHSGLNPGEGVAAITLMQETPVQLLEFIALAGRVNTKVRQNLVFALFYNLVSIPIAASGLLNPIIAATAMLLSSLSVTFNTLLLLKKDQR
ncbi:MAG: cation-translocating P-type ATPase [Desulfobacula sp.]|jgi:heavy metal translocating P-type ATPase|nr:cation-translocating P-type ATPase [Desulfobacula sp.]